MDFGRVADSSIDSSMVSNTPGNQLIEDEKGGPTSVGAALFVLNQLAILA